MSVSHRKDNPGADARRRQPFDRVLILEARPDVLSAAHRASDRVPERRHGLRDLNRNGFHTAASHRDRYQTSSVPEDDGGLGIGTLVLPGYVGELGGAEAALSTAVDAH